MVRPLRAAKMSGVSGMSTRRRWQPALLVVGMRSEVDRSLGESFDSITSAGTLVDSGVTRNVVSQSRR